MTVLFSVMLVVSCDNNAKKTEEAGFTVTFNLCGGKGDIRAQKVSKGATAQEPDVNPTRDSFTFERWSLTENGTEEFDFNTKITKDTVIYAVWKEKTAFTVTFDLSGGNGNIDEQTINKGELALKPTPDPTKDGYTFQRWSLTENGTEEFDFNTKITKDTVIYAVWKEKTAFTVTFDLSGGNGNIDEQTINKGELALKPTPDPTKDGYTFQRWSLTENGTEEFDFNTKITKDTVIYAVWKENPSVTVTFNLCGGKGRIESQKVRKGASATKPQDPARSGYTFQRWSLTENGDTFFFETKITEDTVLYAVWAERPYFLVSFNLSGASGYIDPEKVTKGGFATKPDTVPSRDGYTFQMWSASGDGTAEFNFTGTAITEDMTLYAVWKENPSVTVTFNLCGGEGSIESQKVRKGASAVKPQDPARDGYAFERWSLTENGTQAYDFGNTKMTDDITLYAVWRKLYEVGEQGPGGGIIFYDAQRTLNTPYTDRNGKEVEFFWRYLEAAPEDIGGKHSFGYYATEGATPHTIGTKPDFGKGKANTEAILRWTTTDAPPYYAAKLCDDYSTTVDGVKYDDWFIPSKDELDIMYRELKDKDMGGPWRDDNYWSSTEYGCEYGWSISFKDGTAVIDARYEYRSVRPVRAF